MAETNSLSMTRRRSKECLTRQVRCLLNPIDEQPLVNIVLLVDVYVSNVRLFRTDWRVGTKRCPFEERDFNVASQAVKSDKPALLSRSIKRRVPTDRFPHAGNCFGNQRVELLSDPLLPTRHG